MRDLAPLQRRRRRWPLYAPFIVVVLLAVFWSGFWVYASSRARDAIDGWRAREAQAGRVYTCANESFGGYPFRLEVECANVTAEVANAQSPVEMKAKHILAAVQVYEPSLLISEITGPVTIGARGSRPTIVANWRLAQSSVRGTPEAPERVAIVFDDPSFDRIAGAVQEPMVAARHLELHGRMAGGSVQSNPIIDLALEFTSLVAPSLSPLTAAPADGEIVLTLRGLKDFSPKPWPDRFREIQAQGGRLEITRARVQQGDVIAVGAGSLGLSANGNLDGQMQLTLVGADKVLRELRFDAAAPQDNAMSQQLNSAFGALDKLAPGLGNLARQQAGPALAAGLTAIGKPTTLDGKAAVEVPLRFADGQVFLGPMAVGRTPPLF